MLPSNLFYRIHKSHLVNLDYIKSYSRAEGFHVVLENGTKLDVAYRRNDDFIKVLTKR
jgi:two-component system LytT family response regulator